MGCGPPTGTEEPPWHENRPQRDRLAALRKQYYEQEPRRPPRVKRVYDNQHERYNVRMEEGGKVLECKILRF
jgi:hypothetical protein